jgi:repressor LexA
MYNGFERSEYMSIIQRLVYAMQVRNLTQSQVCYKAKIDKGTLSSYISGRYEPKLDKIEALAKALRVSPTWLMGFSDSMENGTERAPVRIPVLGYVAAGIPIEAITEVLDYEEIEADMLADGSEYFALKIKGDSMAPRINNGDVVIVRRQPDVDSGQIAIVCINGGEATCKKIIKQEGGVLLQPLNQAYTPSYFTNEQIESIPVTIFGRVVELRAKF